MCSQAGRIATHGKREKYVMSIVFLPEDWSCSQVKNVFTELFGNLSRMENTLKEEFLITERTVNQLFIEGLRGALK